MEEENKKENAKKEKLLTKFFKIISRKEIIITFAIGLLIGLIVMFFIHPSCQVASINVKTITQKDLYKKISKSNTSNLLSIALEDIDRAIMNIECKIDEDMQKEIEEQAKNIIEQYESYGYTEETFLEENGFKNYDEFLEDIALYLQRQVYYYNYVETLLEEGAVQKYFEENSFGKIDSKHILVKTSDTVTDEQAMQKAKEIIARLDAGEEFNTVAEEYSNEENIIFEELGYIDFTDSIEEAYTQALKTLEKGKYTQEPVKTSYGYHVIYCVDKIEEKTITTMEKVNVIATLSKELDNLENSNVIFIKLREKYNLKFRDKALKDAYQEVYNQYITTEE